MKLEEFKKSYGVEVVKQAYVYGKLALDTDDIAMSGTEIEGYEVAENSEYATFTIVDSNDNDIESFDGEYYIAMEELQEFIENEM